MPSHSWSLQARATEINVILTRKVIALFKLFPKKIYSPSSREKFKALVNHGSHSCESLPKRPHSDRPRQTSLYLYLYVPRYVSRSHAKIIVRGSKHHARHTQMSFDGAVDLRTDADLFSTCMLFSSRRLVLGLTNGMAPALRTAMREACGQEHVLQGMTYIAGEARIPSTSFMKPAMHRWPGYPSCTTLAGQLQIICGNDEQCSNPHKAWTTYQFSVLLVLNGGLQFFMPAEWLCGPRSNCAKKGVPTTFRWGRWNSCLEHYSCNTLCSQDVLEDVTCLGLIFRFRFL